ncbi:MAG: NAD(+) synthase [Alteromonadaceae bacterium]|nr:NAD(+) synthase [Alteromonadaceae bacterium]
MKIALAQMHVVPMALEQNLNSMLHFIESAKQQDADIVAFPELCLSGYLLSDQWLDRSFCEDLMNYNEVIREASSGIAVIYGNAYVDTEAEARLGSGHYCNKDGRSRLYNAAYIYQNQAAPSRVGETNSLPQGVQPKTLLPNYRFFDDQRYFFSLQDLAIDTGVTLESLSQPYLIDSKNGKKAIGLQVCEDLWCKDYRKDRASINVSKYLVENGAEALINISASPWTFHKHDARDRRIKFLKQELEMEGATFVPFYYVNNVGAQNNGKNIITFDGGTSVYDAQAQLQKSADKPFNEQLLISNQQDFSATGEQRPEEEKLAIKSSAILAGLRHVPELLGWKDAPKFVVGLSGGVDSALVVALLTLAFGKEKVWAVNMPSRYNSQKTHDVAAHICDKLGIRYFQVPIEELVSSHKTTFDELDANCDSPDWMRKLSDENIQAKIRGTSILSNIAGRYGRMFTNNGNKVEIALGYATLYGDVGGVIAPIGDLTKTEVFGMCRYLNETIFKDEVIPNKLLPDTLFEFGEQDIAPSAELRDAQIDPMKFGYHCALLEAFTSFNKVSPEHLLRWYLKGNLARNLNIEPELLSRWGLTSPSAFVEDLEWFTECIRKSVFKRIQSPPIVLTSPSAYGFDIRESQLPSYQTHAYKRLKQEVLELDGYSEIQG